MQNNYPKGVSIVIPNWNHEFVLPRAINSALKAVEMLGSQGIQAEVFVIDDHSRDGSRRLLLQLEALYFDQGLKVLLLDKNIGIVAVRNLALQRARYPYILFMDADNQLFSENIHIFYRAILETKAAVVYGNLVRHGPLNTYLDLWNNEVFQNHIFDQNYLDTFALYDRQILLDDGGFIQHPMMQGHEDWELFLHLAVAGRHLVFVPVMFGIYYEMPQSRVKDVRTDDAKAARQLYIERVFDQLGIRKRQSLNTQFLRYHPDIGYL